MPSTVACAYGGWDIEISFTMGTGKAYVPKAGFTHDCSAGIDANCKGETLPVASTNNFFAMGINTGSNGTYTPGVASPDWGASFWWETTPFVELGASCPVTTQFVVMPVADYNILASYTKTPSLEDVSLMTSAVLLVWAVAWLCKRAVRALHPGF